MAIEMDFKALRWCYKVKWEFISQGGAESVRNKWSNKNENNIKEVTIQISLKSFPIFRKDEINLNSLLTKDGKFQE